MKNGVKWLFSMFGEKKVQQANLAWREVFNPENEQVRMVLSDLAVYCNFTKSSYVVGDQSQTCFNEGSRDAFLHILEMADIDMQTILKILENNNKN